MASSLRKGGKYLPFFNLMKIVLKALEIMKKLGVIEIKWNLVQNSNRFILEMETGRL